MEETGKRRLVIALSAFAGIAYFFVCAVPLPRELGIEPIWSRPLPQAAAELAQTAAFSGGKTSSGGPIHSFRLDSSFGYYNEEGSAISAAAIPFNVAVSDSGYIVYDQKPSFLTLNAPDGRAVARITEQGYPFFGGGRLFVIHPGQASVSEIGPDGKAVWSRDFTAIVTAFDACPGLALFGLMDGRLVGLDPEGRVLLDFAPGGSRIEGIYGCTVSPNGQTAAAICGLDKQRLVILEKRSSAYRVTWHRYLSSDFRRPVSMAFIQDGRQLLYETPSGLGIFDMASRSEAGLDTQALSTIGLFSSTREILLAVEGVGPNKNLLSARSDGHRLFALPFTGESASVALSQDAIFLCIARADGSSRLVRLDFKEE